MRYRLFAIPVVLLAMAMAGYAQDSGKENPAVQETEEGANMQGDAPAMRVEWLVTPGLAVVPQTVGVGAESRAYTPPDATE